MLDTLLSALGYVGDVIDAPGRTVRSAISGRTDATGKDLLRALGADPGEGLGGDAAGLAAEILTDPLTFLGAGLGSSLGRRAMVAAAARGPRYGTKLADVGRMIKEAGKLDDPEALGAFSRLNRGDPEAVRRMLSEVPEGSAYLGAGRQGVAFRTPTGDVVRIGEREETTRPVAEGVLQPTRTVDSMDLRAERVPFADRVGVEFDPLDTATGPLRRQLDDTLERQGLEFFDDIWGNMGLYQGRPVVIDPGAVDAIDDLAFRGGFNPAIEAREPGALMRALLSLAGGDDAMRAALARGRSAPNFVDPFTFGGTGLGANVGAFSRIGEN